MDDILYLEPDEEITSVIDKLRQSQGKRLSLVIPRNASILQSLINLKLLAKEAANLQKDIAIVTADKIGRNLAAQVGLTVYESLKNPRPIYEPPQPDLTNNEEILEIDMSPKQEQEAPVGVSVHHFQNGEPTPRKIQSVVDKEPTVEQPVSKASFIPVSKEKVKVIKPHRPINWQPYRKAILPAIGVLVLALLVGSYFLLPHVKVEIKVAADNFQKTQDFNVSGQSPNPDKLAFSGNYVEATATKEGKFSATGQKNLGGKAGGTITFYNNKDSASHPFAAGTKLSSSSKTFALTKAIAIPGASVQDGKIVPGTVSADITAENPGEEYNVKAGRFTIIDLPAASQEAIYGQSTKDLTGGFSKQVQVISQEDYDKAKTQLVSQLEEQVKEDVANQTQGLQILDKASVLEQTEVKTSGNVNDQATDFTMTVTERERAIAYNQTDFESFVISSLQSQVQADQMVTLGPDDKISPIVKTANFDQKILALTVDASAKVSKKLDIDQIKADLLGKNKSQAESLMASYNGVESFQIEFIPAWWPLKKIPKISKDVEVQLQYQSKEAQ